MFNLVDIFLSRAIDLLIVLLNQLPPANQQIIGYVLQMDAAFSTFLNGVNWFFPVNDFVNMLNFIVTTETVFFFYKLAKFIRNPLGLLFTK